MTKKEVLKDIYPDELPFIFEEMKDEELKQYEEYYNQLIAGLMGNVKDKNNQLSNYMSGITQTIKQLKNDKDFEEEKEKKEPDSVDDIKDKLSNFMGTVKTNRNKRGGG